MINITVTSVVKGFTFSMEKDGTTRVYFGNHEAWPNETPIDQVVRGNYEDSSRNVISDMRKVDYICVSEPAMSAGGSQGGISVPSHGVRAEYVWRAYPVNKKSGKINEDAEPIELDFEPSTNNHFQAIAEQLENQRRKKASSWGLSIMVTERRFLDQHRPKRSNMK